MIWLRDFSWRYFTLTGDIGAYLLYKKHEQLARAGKLEKTETKSV